MQLQAQDRKLADKALQFDQAIERLAKTGRTGSLAFELDQLLSRLGNLPVVRGPKYIPPSHDDTVAQRPAFKPGDKVKIVAGQHAGYRGRVTSSDSGTFTHVYSYSLGYLVVPTKYLRSLA